MKNLPRWVPLLLVLLSVTSRLPAQNESLLIGPGDLVLIVKKTSNTGTQSGKFFIKPSQRAFLVERRILRQADLLRR